MNERKGRDGFALQAGLLFLPPDGWKSQGKIEAAARELLGGLGTLKLESVRIDADPALLEKRIKKWTDRAGKELVAVVGRSGHRQDDFAPETTRRLLHRSLPGVEERMYLASPRRPEDMLFRGAAGIRKGTILVDLPSRPARARQVLRFLAPMLRHALEKIAGDESECAL